VSFVASPKLATAADARCVGRTVERHRQPTVRITSSKRLSRPLERYSKSVVRNPHHGTRCLCRCTIRRSGRSVKTPGPRRRMVAHTRLRRKEEGRWLGARAAGGPGACEGPENETAPSGEPPGAAHLGLGRSSGNEDDVGLTRRAGRVELDGVLADAEAATGIHLVRNPVLHDVRVVHRILGGGAHVHQ